MTETDFLPEELEEVGIKDLLDSESVYTVPWSIWVNSNGRARINGRYTFKEEPGGTASMKITRRGDEILVDTKTINYKFSKNETPPHVGANEENYLPVKFVKGP